MKKYVLGGLAALVLLIVTLLLFMLTKTPEARAASMERVEATPERVARGEYLVNHVAGCLGCHSKRDWNRFGAPIVGHPGAGGTCFTEKWGMPGRVCPPNITPDKATGLGAWSDGEIMRAVREGVGRHGEALFPLMPYPDYRAMSDEDARAMVAYLRSMKRRASEVEATSIDFPVSFFITMVPKPLDGPVTAPPRGETAAYGKYLATIAGCRSCHTPTDDKKRPSPGMDFGGGFEFKAPFGTVRSANITPHATGLKDWSQETFVQRFHAFRAKDAAPKIEPKQNTAMPWLELAGMEESDLIAIYKYLRSVKPIDNKVELRTGSAG